jgi:seryl-tRNA synthetase
MIDLRVLRTDPERVRASQRARGEDPTLLAQAKKLAEDVKAAESDQSEADAQLKRLQLALSNVIEDGVPEGGEDDFVVLEVLGKPRDFAAEGFTPRDHVELGKILGAIDLERGAKVSGARQYYLTGVGALLEFALLNMAMAQITKHGFTPMVTPSLVKPEAMEGTGFLGQAAENVYRLADEDMYLVGTSEVPLAAYHMDEILDGAKLPLRYAGYSSCYRREAGSYGKDTRGIIRVHQFEKVEMFSYCAPEEAEAEHRRLLGFEKDFLTALELPFHVIDVASGDLGSSAARKFDCEAWIPTQGKYREVMSTSNCTEFQARRLSIRMRDEAGVRPVATLNGTLCAMTRMIVAILENHQNADGSVRVPTALRPYLGGMEKLEPVAG